MSSALAGASGPPAFPPYPDRSFRSQ